MAVAFDGEAVQTITYSNAASATITNKTTAGSDRVGIVKVGMYHFGSAPYVSGVTWDGVAMTLVGTDVGAANKIGSSMWIIVAPPTGASSIVITFTAGGVYGAAGAESYSGVNQSAPTSGTATANGASTAPTVTVSSATDDLVTDSLGCYNTAPTPHASQTQTFVDNVLGTVFGTGSYEAGAASVVMSWAESQVEWGQVGVNLEAAGGGSSGNPWYAYSQM